MSGNASRWTTIKLRREFVVPNDRYDSQSMCHDSGDGVKSVVPTDGVGRSAGGKRRGISDNAHRASQEGVD